jgi:hypothetical protein
MVKPVERFVRFEPRFDSDRSFDSSFFLRFLRGCIPPSNREDHSILPLMIKYLSVLIRRSSAH